jgi:hypothetical protein
MTSKIARLFLYVAGALLLATAGAKLVSSFGGARALANSDPITGLTFRNFFQLGGTIELLVALACLFWRKVKFQAGVVSWLATTPLAYRLGLIWTGHKICRCLGNITGLLHIPRISPARHHCSKARALAFGS